MKKTKVKIKWSVQEIQKIVKDGKYGSSETYFVASRKEGRKTVRKLFREVFEALRFANDNPETIQSLTNRKSK